jgi:hypothetical protein
MNENQPYKSNDNYGWEKNTTGNNVYNLWRAKWWAQAPLPFFGGGPGRETSCCPSRHKIIYSTLATSGFSPLNKSTLKCLYIWKQLCIFAQKIFYEQTN